MTDSGQIKILVCFHKPYAVPEDPLYLPIHVGKAGSDADLGIQGDNECLGEPCDNISSMNSLYSEMTGMYWAWKNIRKIYPDLKYIGLCHYRRYFSTEMHTAYLTAERIAKKARACWETVTGSRRAVELVGAASKIPGLSCGRFRKSNEKLRKIIPGSDIVAVRPTELLNTDIRTFMGFIGIAYINLLEETVAAMYPEYSGALKKVLDGSRIHPGNMVILSEKYYDRYCSFVFGALEELLKQIRERHILEKPEEEKAFSRVPGYLSEFLTSAFIRKHEKEARIRYVSRFYV